MSGSEWLVLLAGAAAIVWVNWYFFLAEKTAATATVGASGAQEVTIRVRGGYDPATVRVAKGRPVRLVFDRQEDSSCSEEVVIPDLRVKRFLPAFQKTVVEFEPERAGTYEVTCGMGMLHGRIVVE